MLQAVARERRTINYIAWLGGQASEQVARRVMKMQQMKLRSRSCAMGDGTA